MPTITYNGNPCRNGGHTLRYISNDHCVECRRVRDKAYYDANAERIKERQKEYDTKWRSTYKEKKAKYHAEWYQLNKKREKKKQSAYQNTEHGRKLSKAKIARYRAKKLKQMPPWADQQKINDIYYNCPEGYEVDHIHPISKGGLHVHYNLQIITISENRRKSAKL